MASNPASTRPPVDSEPRTFGQRIDRFWLRVTEGLALSDLWSQFQTDARTSYRLYSKDVDSTRVEGDSRFRHALKMAGGFFWAIVEKLTPARRVLLLIALVLIVIPGGEASWQTHTGEVKVFCARLPLLRRPADVRAADP